jgi:dephospho-CoA kinase
VPLLFETGQQDNYRPVVVVSVTEELQLTRTQQRDRSSSDTALARVRSQMPLAKKVSLADYVIDNSGTDAETCAQADQVLQAIRSELGLSAAGSGKH